MSVAAPPPIRRSASLATIATAAATAFAPAGDIETRAWNARVRRAHDALVAADAGAEALLAAELFARQGRSKPRRRAVLWKHIQVELDACGAELLAADGLDERAEVSFAGRVREALARRRQFEFEQAHPFKPQLVSALNPKILGKSDPETIYGPSAHRSAALQAQMKKAEEKRAQIVAWRQQLQERTTGAPQRRRRAPGKRRVARSVGAPTPPPEDEENTPLFRFLKDDQDYEFIVRLRQEEEQREIQRRLDEVRREHAARHEAREPEREALVAIEGDGDRNVAAVAQPDLTEEEENMLVHETKDRFVVRLEDPDDFLPDVSTTFRKRDIGSDVPGVSFQVGVRRSSNREAIISVLYDKRYFHEPRDVRWWWARNSRRPVFNSDPW